MIVECIKSVLHFVEGRKYEAKQIENNCFLLGNRNMFDGNCFNKYFKIIKESKNKILIKAKKYNMGFVEGNIYLCEVHGSEHFSIYNPVINVYTHIVGMDKLKLYFDIIKMKEISFEDAISKYKQGFVIESVESKTKYKRINGKDYYFSCLNNKYLPNEELDMEEILGEWYSYEE